ncbi:small integral membrane protein 27 [Petaurus breviceps papuanus]|uniref:small integral membrane protein 27 n=1 Tax=Petaurus breviceps papuanus TaxID=3040969 RepID=UPI0036DDC59A
MRPVSCRTLNVVNSVLLLAVVLLSWGFVIYACAAASKWKLEKDYPGTTFSL